MADIVLWEELGWEAIRDRLESGSPVILPVGCVEEHGPHLPVGTDLMQAYHVSLEVARRTGGIVLPPFHYGHSSSTRNFPGSIPISTLTLASLTEEVIEGVIRSGASRILVLTGHAGSAHMAVMKDSLRKIAERHPDVRLWFLTDYEIADRLVEDDRRFPDRDGHAGDIETSRMMAVATELVGIPPKKSFPEFPRHRVLPDPESHFPTGIMGDPEDASAEKGKFLNLQIVDYLVSLIKE